MEQKKNSFRNHITEAEALNKSMRFCSYQERCIQELILAFNKWKVNPKHFDVVIDRLVEEDFINEQRFAELYVSGKFRIKNWGKLKILDELRRKNIDDELIKRAMRKIDEKEYYKTAEKLIQKKAEDLQGLEHHRLRNKVMWYLAGKGYEKEIVFDIFRRIDKHKTEKK